MKIHVQVMDSLLDKLKKIPENTDELASAFYDLDDEAIDAQKKALVEQALQAIKQVRLSWDGSEDEFTSWTDKWMEVVR